MKVTRRHVLRASLGMPVTALTGMPARTACTDEPLYAAAHAAPTHSAPAWMPPADETQSLPARAADPVLRWIEEGERSLRRLPAPLPPYDTAGVLAPETNSSWSTRTASSTIEARTTAQTASRDV